MQDFKYVLTHCETILVLTGHTTQRIFAVNQLKSYTKRQVYPLITEGICHKNMKR